MLIKKKAIIKLLFLMIFASIYSQSYAGQNQFSVLLFIKTVGFEHPSIDDAVQAITLMGNENEFSVTVSDQASSFTVSNLQSFDAVVFLMTTGDVLNDTEQSAFEHYIQNGGGYVGIHSASDTEYDWPWYGALVGAYFNNHPAIQSATINIENKTHPSSQNLPSPWIRTDEWYNFQSNPRDNPNINVLATLDESTYNGGNMGDDHPVIWYQPYDGGRSWYTALGHTAASYTETDFLDHLLGGIKYAAGVAPADPLVVDESGQWFKKQNSNTPFFMAGVGGPEGYLYETDTRKQQIVDQLIASGANALYMHSIRSFAGDGWDYEDPFNIHEDTSSGIADGVFANWRQFLTQLDANGIVTWMHVIDDTARPWGCDVPLNQEAKDYIAQLVTAFRDLNHLVWLSGEEYLMGVCTDAQDKALMQAIADEIKLHDAIHPIGVHHNNGQAMQFADDPSIDVFAQQICGAQSHRSPEGVHAQASFNEDWVYVMAECHPWHLNLLHDNDRTLIRQSNWGTALGGGYTLLYNAYECSHGGKLCSRDANGNPASISDPHDPSSDILGDLNHIREFMSSSRFNELTPNDTLASADTDWVMANTVEGLYVLYAKDNPSSMGIINLTAGDIRLHWFDPLTGNRVTLKSDGANGPFAVPATFTTEAALFIEYLGDIVNRPPMAFNDGYHTNTNVILEVSAPGILMNDFDADQDPLTTTLVNDVKHGTLILNDDGSFNYQPDNDFQGTDEFTYKANDGQSESGQATINIQITDINDTLVAMLIDSSNNTQVSVINNNQQILVTDLNFTAFSVEALQTPVGTNSVRLTLTGPINETRVENAAPYALFGDTKGDFNSVEIINGDYNLRLQAFSAAGAGGNLLAESLIDFSFTDPLDDVIFISGFE